MRAHLCMVSLLCLSACGTPPALPPAGWAGAGQPALREPTPEELRRSFELAEVVLVGRVWKRTSTAEGIAYRLRPVELLRSTQPDDAHPCEVGGDLHLLAFLFRSGGGRAEIGGLEVFSEYIFFLSRAQGPAKWLNLEDAAGFPLPGAEKTLERLRHLAASSPGATLEPPPLRR